jgi:hypothetical protein
MLRSLGAEYWETVERGRALTSRDSVWIYEHAVGSTSAACLREICGKEMRVKRSERETDTELTEEPPSLRRLFCWQAVRIWLGFLSWKFHGLPLQATDEPPNKLRPFRHAFRFDARSHSLMSLDAKLTVQIMELLPVWLSRFPRCFISVESKRYPRQLDDKHLQPVSFSVM